MMSSRLLEAFIAAIVTAMTGCSADHVKASAMEGDTVHLPCNREVTAPVDWRYQRDPTDHNVYICIGGRLLDEFKPRFTLSHNYTLAISNVTDSDSGFYMCLEDSGLGITHTFLIFVEKQQHTEASTTSSDPAKATLPVYVTIAVVVVFLVVAVVIATFVWRRYRCRSPPEGKHSRQLNAITAQQIPVDAFRATADLEPQASTQLLKRSDVIECTSRNGGTCNNEVSKCTGQCGPRCDQVSCSCPDGPRHEIQTDNMATGITEMDGKIYVIQMLCSDILVYDSIESTTEKMSDIKINGIFAPRDIVACHTTKRLYVLDLGKSCRGCIWKVSPSGEGEKFIESITSSKPIFKPHTLSVRDGRLLVTTNDDGVVLVGQNKQILEHIKRADLKIQHAVETSQQTFIICCMKPRPTVVEIEKSGLEIRQYTGECNLQRPCYLSVNSGGGILVTDSSQHCILLLNNNLQLVYTVVSQNCGKLAEHPSRIHYASDTHRLLVCCGDEWSSTVQIYGVQFHLNVKNEVH